MLKSQYIALILAAILLVGLSLLPKSVVRTKEKSMAESEKQGATSANSVQDTVAEKHTATLSGEQAERLAALRKGFAQAKSEKEQQEYLDSLAVIYRSANLLDSVVHYASLVYQRFPSLANLTVLADTHYEIFSFAISEQRVKQAALQAQKYYEQLLKEVPDNSEVKVKLGMTYTVTENPMQGIKLIREVVADEPDNQLAIFNLGLLSMQSGQYEKAVERFEKLIKLNPQDINAYFLLAQSLANMGKTKDAVKHLETLKSSVSDQALRAKIDAFQQELGKE